MYTTKKRFTVSDTGSALDFQPDLVETYTNVNLLNVTGGDKTILRGGDIGALLNIRTVEGCEAVRDQTVFKVGTKSSGCD